MTGDQLDLFGGAPREAPRSALAEALKRVCLVLEDALREPCSASQPATLHAPSRHLARLVGNWPGLARLSPEANLLDRADLSRVVTRRSTATT